MKINPAAGCRTEKNASSVSKTTSRNAAKHKSSAAGALPKLDTFERSSARPFGGQMAAAGKRGLHLEGGIPSAGELALYEPDEAEKDGIDWEGIEQYVSHINVTLENADDIQRSVHHTASLYLAAKTCLQHQFSGREDILEEKMSKLDGLMAQAKSRLVASYQNSVGRFYEQAGNPGAASRLGQEFSKAIEERFGQIESLAKEKGILGSKEEVSYPHLSLSLEVMSLENWIHNPEAEASSLKDLEAAGFVAKAAVSMDPNEWGMMSDGELGIHLALQYMKMAHTLGHLNISEEMSSLLLGSFESYMGQLSGGALTHRKETADPYQYTLKQYREHGDIRKAFLAGAHKYLEDGFFSTFITAPGGTGMSHATRYNLSISQFFNSLESGNSGDILKAIAANGVYSMGAKINSETEHHYDTVL